MKPPAGYLIRYSDGLRGERGLYFDYILSANGIWIEAEGALMAARVPVALAGVRGLGPLEPKAVLRYGRIPQRFFDLALSAFMVDINRERYVAVTWNDGYHLYVPEQEGESAGVEYQVGDSVMLDLHSHGHMGAWFSTKDNEDEKGLKLYGVVGKLGGTPVVRLRVGVYGYFHPIGWGDVFDGYLNGAVESEEEKVGISQELLEEAYQDPGVSGALKEDIERELHRDVDG